jgi:hypothetical protein
MTVWHPLPQEPITTKPLSFSLAIFNVGNPLGKLYQNVLNVNSANLALVVGDLIPQYKTGHDEIYIKD